MRDLLEGRGGFRGPLRGEGGTDPAALGRNPPRGRRRADHPGRLAGRPEGRRRPGPRRRRHAGRPDVPDGRPAARAMEHRAHRGAQRSTGPVRRRPFVHPAAGRNVPAGPAPAGVGGQDSGAADGQPLHRTDPAAQLRRPGRPPHRGSGPSGPGRGGRRRALVHDPVRPGLAVGLGHGAAGGPVPGPGHAADAGRPPGHAWWTR